MGLLGPDNLRRHYIKSLLLLKSVATENLYSRFSFYIRVCFKYSMVTLYSDVTFSDISTIRCGFSSTREEPHPFRAPNKLSPKTSTDRPYSKFQDQHNINMHHLKSTCSTHIFHVLPVWWVTAPVLNRHFMEIMCRFNFKEKCCRVLY